MQPPGVHGYAYGMIDERITVFALTRFHPCGQDGAPASARHDCTLICVWTGSAAKCSGWSVAVEDILNKER
jgi:hypothetical protein